MHTEEDDFKACSAENGRLLFTKRLTKQKISARNVFLRRLPNLQSICGCFIFAVSVFHDVALPFV